MSATRTTFWSACSATEVTYGTVPLHSEMAETDDIVLLGSILLEQQAGWTGI